MQKDIAINLKGRVMNNFSCNDCVGMCCACPPSILSEDEIIFAIASGVRVIAIDRGGVYAICVAKDGPTCPYLDNTGKCSIYDNRFDACRAFECSALDEEKQAFVRDHGYMDIIKKLTTNKSKAHDSIYFNRAIISKYKIEVVDLGKWTQLINGVDLSFALTETIRIIDKNT